MAGETAGPDLTLRHVHNANTRRQVRSAFMKNHLPPEDQPSGQGLIPASAAEVYVDVLAHNQPDGPWAAGQVFHDALLHDDGPQLAVLKNLVTPESLAAWGDFSAAREHLAGTCMTSRADIPAPGAAYVKFVTDPGQALISDGYTPIMTRAIATLQYRPDSGRWLVHQLGEYCLPEDLPPLRAAG
jgi:hypothetical protein